MVWVLEDEHSLQNFKKKKKKGKEEQYCPAGNLMPQKLASDTFLHLCTAFQIRGINIVSEYVPQKIIAPFLYQRALFNTSISLSTPHNSLLKFWQIPAGLLCTL